MIGLIIGLIILIGIPVVCIKAVPERDRFDAGLFATVFSVILALIIMPLIWCLWTGLYEGYSEGSRVGYVTKLSHKGLIWKTWEGQMQLGQGANAALQEPFEFNVPVALVQKVQHAAESGERVKLLYTQWLITPAWLAGAASIVTGIEKPKERLSQTNCIDLGGIWSCTAPDGTITSCIWVDGMLSCT